MSNEKELKERLEDVNRKIGVMEWDKSKNQFNPGKTGIYNDLKEQQQKLLSDLNLLNSDDTSKVETNSEDIVKEE